MRTNLYYATVLTRRNIIREAILDFFYRFCSYPRLLLEVFIRKNFGERYFSMASVLTVAFILFSIPIIQHYGTLFFEYPIFGRHGRSHVNFWTLTNATWYFFITAFLVAGFYRRREIKRSKSSFDFAKFSKYSGDINPKFRSFDLFGLTKANVRKAQIFWEPAIFLLIGITLILLGQGVGKLIFISSIFYSIGYAGAYRTGDNFVLDEIDRMILNEELAAVIINDKSEEDARGVRFYAQKPSSKALRKNLVDQIIIDEPVVFAI